uniref:Liver-expressed antimicrobial peptide 2 n=1 Tax=Erpetoichthys calabaricus TaxID=27687 RepID=A0A8C4SBW1_ERPCA
MQYYSKAKYIAIFLQISSIPIQSQLSKSRSESLKVLHRMARMTPLWRSMGSKPHGAYCHDHHECSTKMCRCAMKNNRTLPTERMLKDLCVILVL